MKLQLKNAAERKLLSFQDSEELSDEEEMKIAEMRPPLIEISINQPKVVTLSKDKKGNIRKEIMSASLKCNLS